MIQKQRFNSQAAEYDYLSYISNLQTLSQLEFKKLYSVWISYGLSSKFENEKNKRIKILNGYAIIWLHLILFFFVATLITQGFSLLNDHSKTIINYTDLIAQGVTALFLFPVLHLNKNYHFGIARALFLSIAFINVFAYAIFIFPGNFTEYYFLIHGGLSLSLFKRNVYPFILMVISFCLFLTPYYFFDAYSEDYIERLLLSPALRLFISLYLLFNYFKRLNHRNEKLLSLEKDKVLSDKIILQKQESELRKLNDFKSHFFVNFSHEIRTPITLIKGYTSRIESKDAENQKKLNIVNEQISNIESILNNILDLSKIDANELRLEKTQVDFEPLIKKHYINFIELFNKKNIDFSLNADIPKLSIFCDEEFIAKSLNNLLSNALKFTPKNGNVTIEIKYNTDLSISIIDNGIGIPEEDLTKIFDRFYQSKNEINKSQGSGIGLAFTKNIIEAHGFSIEAQSKPYKTTRFTITIPNQFVTEEIEFVNTKINLSHRDNKDKPTILIVDDYKQLRDYLKDVLSDYQILEAENGAEALKIIQSQPIDLLITDYMMPKMDGKELIKNIKKAKLKFPIIILTARIDESVKLRMLRIGVDDYLIKPFLEEELLLTVKKSLEAHTNILVEKSNLLDSEVIDFENLSSDFSIKIAQKINDNIASSDFGVQDIADYFDISKSTLNRRAKAILGQTTQQLILQARLEKARDIYLQNPKMTQKEIAKKVGMSNTSYLFKKLKETYGKQYKPKV